MKVKDFEPQAAATGLETGGFVRPVDKVISSGPHDKELFPNGGDNGGGPKSAGGLTAEDVLLLEVVILESRPF